jgi:hypothetical protein
VYCEGYLPGKRIGYVNAVINGACDEAALQNQFIYFVLHGSVTI